MVPELHGCDGGVIGGLVADHGAAAVAGGGAGGAPGLDAALPVSVIVYRETSRVFTDSSSGDMLQPPDPGVVYHQRPADDAVTEGHSSEPRLALLLLQVQAVRHLAAPPRGRRRHQTLNLCVVILGLLLDQI